MPRVTNGPATLKRRKALLKQTKGYFGNKSRLFRFAKDAFWRAKKYAYRDRRKKKTEMRQLWIVRVNAACRSHGMAYSRFINGLQNAAIEVDRKNLSEMAIHNEAAFRELVLIAQKHAAQSHTVTQGHAESAPKETIQAQK
jgi:large subunit ribosomal protein L20